MPACLPACIYYTHMCVHIHNCSDMILCATCHKRPPVLSDCFCWAGGVVAENRFLISLEMWILCAYLSIYIERITFFCNNTKQFLVVACILSHTSMLFVLVLSLYQKHTEFRTVFSPHLREAEVG